MCIVLLAALLLSATLSVTAHAGIIVFPRDCRIQTKYLVQPNTKGVFVADAFDDASEAAFFLASLPRDQREQAVLVQLARGVAFRPKDGPIFPEEYRARFAVAYRVPIEESLRRPKPERFAVKAFPAAQGGASTAGSAFGGYLDFEGMNVGIGSVDGAEKPGESSVVVVIELFTPCSGDRRRSVR